MQFIVQNLEALLMVGLVVWWLAQVAGPTLRAKWPAIRDKMTAKNLTLPVVAVVLALKHFSPVMVPQPVTPQREPDIVDRCGIAGRALLADALEQFASKKFDTDQARETAINEKIHDVIEASFVPVNAAIASAIKAGRVTECAERIRKGELRE